MRWPRTEWQIRFFRSLSFVLARFGLFLSGGVSLGGAGLVASSTILLSQQCQHVIDDVRADNDAEAAIEKHGCKKAGCDKSQ